MDTGGGDQDFSAEEIVVDMLNQAMATVVTIVANDLVNDECNATHTSATVFDRDTNEGHNNLEKHSPSSIGIRDRMKDDSRESPTSLELNKRDTYEDSKQHSGTQCQHPDLHLPTMSKGQLKTFLNCSPGMAISGGKQWSRTLQRTTLKENPWWSMRNEEKFNRLKQALNQYEQYTLQSHKGISLSSSLMKACWLPTFSEDQLMSLKMQCNRSAQNSARDLRPEAPVRRALFNQDSSTRVRKHPARVSMSREDRVKRLRQRVMAEYELDKETREQKIQQSLSPKHDYERPEDYLQCSRTNRESGILTIYSDDTEYTNDRQLTYRIADLPESNRGAVTTYDNIRVFPPKYVATETTFLDTVKSTHQPEIVDTGMSDEQEKSHADLVALNSKIKALQDQLKTFEAYILQACELHSATEVEDSDKGSAQSEVTSEKLSQTYEGTDDFVDEEELWEDTYRDSSITSGTFITVFGVESSKFDYYILDYEPEVKAKNKKEEQNKGLGNRISRSLGRICGRKSKD